MNDPNDKTETAIVGPDEVAPREPLHGGLGFGGGSSGGGGGGGGTVPSGTGFVHITGGLQDAAARAVSLSTADTTSVLPLSKFAIGAAAAMLVMNAGATAAAYVNMSGDGTLSAAGALNVVAITGTGGTAGSIAIGDAVHALTFAQPTSTQSTPPSLTLNSSTGFSGAASAGGNGALFADAAARTPGELLEFEDADWKILKDVIETPFAQITGKLGNLNPLAQLQFAPFEAVILEAKDKAPAVLVMAAPPEPMPL